MGRANKWLQYWATCARRCGEIVCAAPGVNTNRCWRLTDCLVVLLVALSIRVALLLSNLDTPLGKELGYAALALVIVAYGVRRRKMSLTEMGVAMTRGTICWIAAAIVLATLAAVGMVYAQHDSYRLLLQTKLRGLDFRFECEEFNRTGPLLALAAVSEEMFFRGVLLGALLRRFQKPSAVIIQACGFGALHYFFWGRDAVLGAAVLGALLACFVIKTGSLWPAIAGHILASFVLFYWLPVL